MTFLQSFMLFALPLVGLPVLIHLINQHRHKTMQWGAMMFLLDAKRMTRGMARLKHFLILAARTLAIAGLIFALSRPLASGWIGLTAGGAPDTTIILLDRSASMEQMDLQTGVSKRSAALTKLSGLLKATGRQTRLVLVESTAGKPQEIDSPDELIDIPDTGASSTTANLPEMMQTALDYVTTNQTGRTDVWVCSDLRDSDWNADGGRWDAIRSGFADRDGVRFYLLTYPGEPKENIGVTVSAVHRRQIGADAELVMDLKLTRETTAKDPQPIDVPIQFILNGQRTVLPITMTDYEYVRQGHSIKLDREVKAGSGRVELPADSNPQDNRFHFVFAEPPLHKTLIISDNDDAVRVMKIAAEAEADQSADYEAEVLASARVDEIEWDTTACILWQAPLPKGFVAEQLEKFVESGRTVIFFPPEKPTGDELFGVTWGEWQNVSDNAIAVEDWRQEADILGNTQNGSALPVGDLLTYRYCKMNTEGLTRLAWYGRDADMMLGRVPSENGAAYFCSTLPTAQCSTMTRKGIVFYIMFHRTLSQGAASLGRARQLDAGSVLARNLDGWTAADEPSQEVLPSQRAFQAGAWRSPDERLLALNRPLQEDSTKVLDKPTVEKVFSGLDYTQIDDEVSNTSALANEIWRTFLVVMALALIAEAFLCLPEKRAPATEVAT